MLRYSPNGSYLAVGSAVVSHDRRRVVLEVPGMEAGRVVWYGLARPADYRAGELEPLPAPRVGHRRWGC